MPELGPHQPPEPGSYPHLIEGGSDRNCTISPADTPTVDARVELMNQNRAKVGLPPIQVEVNYSRQQDLSDPIFVNEIAAVRVLGATQEELNCIFNGSLRYEPERKVKAGNVMAAAVVAHRLNGKVYVGRGQGENSVPDQVDRFIADGPGGPLRQRLAPTQADKDEAGRIRIWVRSQQPTNDYQAAVRQALITEYISVREAGTAASALSGFTRYQERLEVARQRALAKNGGQQSSDGAAVHSPRPGGSRWLGQKKQKVSVTARVEVARPVINEYADLPRVLYIMRTPQCDLVRWFASEDEGLRPGDAVTIQGTIKDHSTFNGERQTEIWYCKPPVIHPPMTQPPPSGPSHRIQDTR